MSTSTFIIERAASAQHQAGFYYFRCNATRKMEVVDMKSLVERLQMTIKSHRERNVLTHQLTDMENDYNIACDGLPRLFIHAVAWILANDMKVEGPFRQSPKKVTQNELNVMASNGYMPLYSSHVPEALIKEWLKMIPGCVIKFTEDWRYSNAANARYELARNINTKMNVSQRKVFAVMVALAHCIVRHHQHTLLATNSAISTVFAQNVFSLANVPPTDLPRLTPLTNDIFTEILNQTSTPEKFRQMFFSLFPGTPQPQATVVARHMHYPTVPVPRISRVVLSPPATTLVDAVGSAGAAGTVLANRQASTNRAAARRRSQRDHALAPRLDAREILNRPEPELPSSPSQSQERDEIDDDIDSFTILIPSSPTH